MSFDLSYLSAVRKATLGKQRRFVKRGWLVAVALSAFAGAGVSLASVAAAPAAASPILFELGANGAQNVGAPNYCLTSLGGGVGTQAELWQCAPYTTDANQVWYWVGTAAGAWQLKNQGDGLCLSDLGNTGDHVAQFMETCDGSANQQYPYNPQNGQLGVSGGTSYVLSSNGDLSNGGVVSEFTPDGSMNQDWYLACNGGSCSG